MGLSVSGVLPNAATVIPKENERDLARHVKRR